MNNHINLMKLAAYIEGRPVDMRRISHYSPYCDGLCIIGHAKDLWGTSENSPPFTILLGLETGEEYASLICPRNWETPPPEQKERVLALLRGQIRLTPDWLHNPEWVDAPQEVEEKVLCTTS